MSMRIKISLPALEKVMKAEKVDQYKLKKLLINALIIRLFICVLVLLVGKNMNEIYFISDDAAYENLAKAYLQSASSPIDLGALTLIGATGYLQIFWVCQVFCVSFKKIFWGGEPPHLYHPTLLNDTLLKYFGNISNRVSCQ